MKRLLSGMRPTGSLHLGHLVGALDNWVKLQKEYECFFMIADWHALMSEYENPKALEKNSMEMLADWKAAARRSPDKKFEDTLDYAKKKYGISDQLFGIMLNTFQRLVSLNMEKILLVLTEKVQFTLTNLKLEISMYINGKK